MSCTTGEALSTFFLRITFTKCQSQVARQGKRSTDEEKDGDPMHHKYVNFHHTNLYSNNNL